MNAPLAPAMLMPFGKYKDQPLAKLPNFYLRWLLNQSWLKPAIADALLDEYDRRHPNARH
jgi:uncharacterized protein (DUF3820 family)